MNFKKTNFLTFCLFFIHKITNDVVISDEGNQILNLPMNNEFRNSILALKNEEVNSNDNKSKKPESVDNSADKYEKKPITEYKTLEEMIRFYQENRFKQENSVNKNFFLGKTFMFNIYKSSERISKQKLFVSEKCLTIKEGLEIEQKMIISNFTIDDLFLFRNYIDTSTTYFFKIFNVSHSVMFEKYNETNYNHLEKFQIIMSTKAIFSNFTEFYKDYNEFKNQWINKSTTLTCLSIDYLHFFDALDFFYYSYQRFSFTKVKYLKLYRNLFSDRLRWNRRINDVQGLFLKMEFIISMLSELDFYLSHHDPYDIESDFLIFDVYMRTILERIDEVSLTMGEINKCLRKLEKLNTALSRSITKISEESNLVVPYKTFKSKQMNAAILLTMMIGVFFSLI